MLKTTKTGEVSDWEFSMVRLSDMKQIFRVDASHVPIAMPGTNPVATSVGSRRHRVKGLPYFARRRRQR